ncbi:hypothetical protein DPMN_031929 [Dreissena polymorpha]|uniref:Uncharacterized protein n=1 Tax=Dreissena polymorpha TaxID=45954 RepID=A0A9D4RGK1_DREPO|nr:hypothetical protein DPMN_028891 [Dreissena polymorpha]KAH3868776.1 hypothetical protein DPMN_031929 [Dreissena polymorpha]
MCGQRSSRQAFSQAQFSRATLSAKVKLCVASVAPDKPSHRPSLVSSYPVS